MSLRAPILKAYAPDVSGLFFMEEIKIGACTSCDKQIFDASKPKGSRFTEEYREHTLGLSNETLMRVGVCASCKEILDSDNTKAQELANQILERHKIWWRNNLPETKQPYFFKNIAVTNVTTDEDAFREKLSEKEKEKQMTREWQTEKTTQNILDVEGNKIVETLEEFRNRKE